MSSQLDILALEPFYGGVRRHMLDTVIRCSRHRWTLLKLPPRRIERRLSVAANWFSEQLSRHWSGRSDLLFTSEAMNLASLYRLVPAIARQPSVVYFHDNQLSTPQVQRPRRGRSMEEIALSSHAGAAVSTLAAQPSAIKMAQRDVDLAMVNLNTATAATEIWFNSNSHLKTFLANATKLVAKYPELSSHDPMPQVTAKAHVMQPPMDLNLVPHVKATMKTPMRDSRAIFVDTRDAHMRTLNTALSELALRGEKFRLITVGPVEDLSDQWPRRTVSETDDYAHINGLIEAGVVLSVRPHAACDLQVVRGLQTGCRPVLPDRGIYPDLIPPRLHDTCLYAFNVDALVIALQDAINPPMAWRSPDFQPILRSFEAIAATKLFDERLSSLAAGQAAQ